MDRLTSMRVFAKVVDQGSFARAGLALDMSNAVVTRHVAELEAHLATRLLNRTTRKLSLTETGRAYLQRVLQILQEVDDAVALVSSHATAPGGTLRIYSQIGFGRFQLARLLPLYAQRYPDVILDVTLSDQGTDLVEEGFDVGLFTGLQKFDSSMVARQLGISEILLCAAPSYLERHGAPATPKDVSAHACLNFSNVEQLRHHWPVVGPKGVANIPIESRMLSNNGDFLRHCAAAGMGLVISPSFSLSEDLQSRRLVRLLPKHHLGQISVMMVYPSRRLLSAKMKSFVEFVSTQFPQPQIDPWAIPEVG
jgi:DNA-binding transcriptional LysR family regulator